MVDLVEHISEQVFIPLTVGGGLRSLAAPRPSIEVVIGLSGGIDLSLLAVIAVDALGPENVIG